MAASALQHIVNSEKDHALFTLDGTQLMCAHVIRMNARVLSHNSVKHALTSPHTIPYHTLMERCASGALRPMGCNVTHCWHASSTANLPQYVIVKQRPD